MENMNLFNKTSVFIFSIFKNASFWTQKGENGFVDKQSYQRRYILSLICLILERELADLSQLFQ